MKDDDAKKAILARRARFIAAAMVSAGIGASCEKEPPPEPCLSVSQTSSPGPSVCLSPVPTPCLAVGVPTPPPDAGTAIDGGTDDAGAPRPQPCLAHRPPPKPCLSPKPRICLDY